MRSWWILVLAVLMLSGCAELLQVTPYVDPSGGVVFTPETRIRVEIANDGAYGKIVYTGSGQILSQMIYNSLSKRLRWASMARKYEDLDSLLDKTDPSEVRYIVYPTILHWEDRNTPWSRLLDRVNVRIEIIDVELRKTVNSVNIEATNRWLIFVVNDPPEVLLQKPVEDYVASLF